MGTWNGIHGMVIQEWEPGEWEPGMGLGLTSGQFCSATLEWEPGDGDSGMGPKNGNQRIEIIEWEPVNGNPGMGTGDWDLG